MLLSTVFILRPVVDTVMPMTLGNAFYTAFLQLVGNHDPELATWLHDAEGPKPFTTSPLQGPVTVRDRQILVHHDRDYWLRVTSVAKRLSEVLLAVEERPPAMIRLHEGQFEVQQVSHQAADHPWALYMPYEALYEAALSHDVQSWPQVAMVFESPTAFRSQGRTTLFPVPRLAFGSLLTRWNYYAPMPIEESLMDVLDTDIDVDRYDLKTQMQNFGRYQLQVGFVGRCTFGARKGAEAEVVWCMRLLAKYAFFAGVGYRTTIGMGQVRLQV